MFFNVLSGGEVVAKKIKTKKELRNCVENIDFETKSFQLKLRREKDNNYGMHTQAAQHKKKRKTEKPAKILN